MYMGRVLIASLLKPLVDYQPNTGSDIIQVPTTSLDILVK